MVDAAIFDGVHELTRTSIAFLVITTVAVGLRFYTRAVLLGRFALDDYAMIMAYVSDTGVVNMYDTSADDHPALLYRREYRHSSPDDPRHKALHRALREHQHSPHCEPASTHPDVSHSTNLNPRSSKQKQPATSSPCSSSKSPSAFSFCTSSPSTSPSKSSSTPSCASPSSSASSTSPPQRRHAASHPPSSAPLVRLSIRHTKTSPGGGAGLTSSPIWCSRASRCTRCGTRL